MHLTKTWALSWERAPSTNHSTTASMKTDTPFRMAKVNSQDTRCVHSKVVSLQEKERVKRVSSAIQLSLHRHPRWQASTLPHLKRRLPSVVTGNLIPAHLTETKRYSLRDGLAWSSRVIVWLYWYLHHDDSPNIVSRVFITKKKDWWIGNDGWCILVLTACYRINRTDFISLKSMLDIGLSGTVADNCNNIEEVEDGIGEGVLRGIVSK